MNNLEKEAVAEMFRDQMMHNVPDPFTRMSDMRTAKIRTFDGGATRNNDPVRIDWFKMMSLPVLFQYADYMRRNRQQFDEDGNLVGIRDFDNWKQGGFPHHETCESLERHVLDLAALTDGVKPMRPCNIPDTCCAIMFGAMAYLHKYIEELNS